MKTLTWLLTVIFMRWIGDTCWPISSNEFNILLENTPYLYSLTTDASILQTLTANWTHIPTCNKLSHKIRSLKLYLTTSVLWKLNIYEINEILSSFVRIIICSVIHRDNCSHFVNLPFITKSSCTYHRRRSFKTEYEMVRRTNNEIQSFL